MNMAAAVWERETLKIEEENVGAMEEDETQTWANLRAHDVACLYYL